MPVINIDELIKNRVEAIRKYHWDHGVTRAQLDVSGGVDSAVMLGLLARAIGPKNITAVYSSINSSKSSEERAIDVARHFGVELIELNLTDDFRRLSEYLIEKAVRVYPVDGTGSYTRDREAEVRERVMEDPTVLGSFRSCLRAPVGRFMNRLLGNGIRHGTGNECEDRWLRFYQKGGDGEVDTNPIAMLSKGEVYQLALGLAVPESILAATPSPDLQGVGDQHNDEAELQALTGVSWTYSRIHLRDDPETGAERGDYAKVGTIEKMSRFLDHVEISKEKDLRSAVNSSVGNRPGCRALAERLFGDDWYDYVLSAFTIERQTQHKENPNCPTLGIRKELLLKGILTDKLPDE